MKGTPQVETNEKDGAKTRRSGLYPLGLTLAVGLVAAFWLAVWGAAPGAAFPPQPVIADCPASLTATPASPMVGELVEFDFDAGCSFALRELYDVVAPGFTALPVTPNTDLRTGFTAIAAEAGPTTVTGTYWGENAFAYDGRTVFSWAYRTASLEMVIQPRPPVDVTLTDQVSAQDSSSDAGVAAEPPVATDYGFATDGVLDSAVTTDYGFTNSGVPAHPGLAFTGVSSGLLSFVGVVLVAVGAASMGAARRARHRET